MNDNLAIYQPYAEYKDSGVEWLGKIPSHWYLIQFKRILVGVKDGTHGTHKRLNDGFPLLSAKNIQNGNVRISESESLISYKDYKHITANGFPKKDDLLITCVGSIGRSCLYPFDKPMAFQRSVAFLRLNNRAYPLYYNYFIESKFYQMQLEANTKTSTQGGVYLVDLVDLIVYLPPLQEQTQIANFLDHETAKIDNLIAKQQRLIELLIEKRQAVISHAVTKGLNPNAPMKDSGIEWLGEIPEGWNIEKLKYLITAIGDVDHYMPNTVENGKPYLMTGDLKEKASNIKFDNCKKICPKNFSKLSKKIKTEKGDLILARYATIGTVCYVDIDYEFIVSYACVTVKPKISKILGLFMFYYFKSDVFAVDINSRVNTNTQGNVGIGDLKTVTFTVPPKDEQLKIVNHINSSNKKFDNLIDKATLQIDLLKERRTALISSAVTGKIDVRNWQAPETDTA